MQSRFIVVAASSSLSPHECVECIVWCTNIFSLPRPLLLSVSVCPLKYSMSVCVWCSYGAIVVKCFNQNENEEEYSRGDTWAHVQSTLRMTLNVSKDLMYLKIMSRDRYEHESRAVSEPFQKKHIDTSSPDCIRRMAVRPVLFRRWIPEQGREAHGRLGRR
jgi:hypothetical protein